jgi:predicted ester cyclase
MNRRALWTFVGIAALPLLGGAFAAPPAAAAPVAKVGAEARKTTVRAYISIWQSGRIDRLGTVIAAGYSGHAAAGDRDLAGLKERITAFRSAYPDMRFTIEDQVIQGDRVATRMTATGTSAKTGRAVRLVGLNISRFSGNRIVEEWPVWEVATNTH